MVINLYSVLLRGFLIERLESPLSNVMLCKGGAPIMRRIFLCWIIVVCGISFAADPKETIELCKRTLTLAVNIPTMSHFDMIREVVQLYPEMKWLTGEVHATPEGILSDTLNDSLSKQLFGKQHIEFDRTANGIAFLNWVLGRRYDEFIQPQGALLKLSRESFDRLHEYTKRILKTPEDVDAMITYMVINDLGKIDSIVKYVETTLGVKDVDHDKILFKALKQHPEISPSFQRLSSHHKALILNGLEANFNIGQFMQGENVPASLAGLSGLDKESLDFYLLHALSDLSGAAGHVKSVGSVVMTDHVFRNFESAVKAIEGFSKGHSPKQVYNNFLADRAAGLGLDVSKPTERAMTRIALMLRASTPTEAKEIEEVFSALPKNVQAILTHELNLSGIEDGTAILLYYSPATLANAKAALKNAGDPLASRHGLEIGLMTFARLFQEGRIEAKGRQGNGVFTVFLGKIAEAAKDPLGLSNKTIVLNPFGEDVEALLQERLTIVSSTFSKMETLAEIPGKKVGVIGIGGGSDVLQAAQLAQLLQGQNKEIRFVISVRTEKPTSQGATNEIDVARTVENPKEVIGDNVYNIGPNSSGSGRFLEALPASRFPVYLVIDSQDGSLGSRIQAAIEHAGGSDTVIAVDTGGDALYNNQSGKSDKATPDQDLRVLKTLSAIPKIEVITAEIAVGVDAPSNAQHVLAQANAKYYQPTNSDIETILATYKHWQMDGSNDKRFGKTAFAWQIALLERLGLQTLPLPTRVITDPKNPWNPFVHIDPSMQGIFFMSLREHLNMISQATSTNEETSTASKAMPEILNREKHVFNSIEKYDPYIITLLTPEELNKLPNGTVVESITGKRFIVGTGKIDDETGDTVGLHDYTAYGLRVPDDYVKNKMYQLTKSHGP